MREDVVHNFGPFQGIKTGDILQVMYQGEQIALVRVTRVKAFAIECYEGESKCKITMVTPKDIRFYADITPLRATVLRNISFSKYEEE